MRSRELETKFHQMNRSPSSGAPPTSITRASLRAWTSASSPSGSTAMCPSGSVAVDVTSPETT